MIQRYNQKLPVCAFCLEPGHTAFKCGKKPHKTLNTYNGLKVSSSFGGQRKPLRKEAIKTRQKRLATTAAWDAENPPDANGYWYCYIPKHPLCPRRLTKETLVREHDLSKARSPGDKHNIKNIYPACAFDNRAKGSLSAAEYMAKPVGAAGLQAGMH